jgi:CubicO group peptidase (beta-lactamase class C family)
MSRVGMSGRLGVCAAVLAAIAGQAMGGTGADNGPGGVAGAGLPYDFSAATALITAELPDLSNRVAIIVRQGNTDIYRYQSGEIGYGTKTRLASFTKTLSAGVVLALRDEGLLSLTDTFGSALPTFALRGIGSSTVLDAFGMRYGVTTPQAYEIDRRYTLAQSVTLIGLTGTQTFAPGTVLNYDGSGMQVVGRMAELATGQSWETIARQRIFDKCAMPTADYGYFAPNPAVAGGAQGSADETIRFAQMVMDNGVYNGARVLSPASVDQLFVNATLGLPVENNPFPAQHPLYPYGQQPDYGFGTWVFAQNPSSGIVEEVVGAGAWGSYMWLDRRRGVYAVLITDVPAGTQGSSNAMFGLMAIVRQQTELHQARDLATGLVPGGMRVSWSAPAGGVVPRAYRLTRSLLPIRSTMDLRGLPGIEVPGGTTSVVVPASRYFAVTAIYGQDENLAMVPGESVLVRPAQCSPADIADTDGEPGSMPDGLINNGDFTAFFTAFFMPPEDPAHFAADIANTDAMTVRDGAGADGVVDNGDFTAFFADFFAGCR